MSVWSDCLNHLDINNNREPRNRYTDSGKQPDISVFDFGSGSKIELHKNEKIPGGLFHQLL